MCEDCTSACVHTLYPIYSTILQVNSTFIHIYTTKPFICHTRGVGGVCTSAYRMIPGVRMRVYIDLHAYFLHTFYHTSLTFYPSTRPSPLLF